LHHVYWNVERALTVKEIAGQLAVFRSCVLPSEVSAIKDVEIALAETLMQALCIRNRDERIMLS
jgi:hypothetical protein